MTVQSMTMMALSERYIAFLEQPAPVHGLALCDALAAHGLTLEAHLLRYYIDSGTAMLQISLEDSPWSGRRAHLGPVLPASPTAGDIWFDPYELAPMLLLPRPPMAPGDEIAPEMLARLTPFISWIALRPVMVWQYRAFLHLAPIGRRATQMEPPFPLLDAERILQGAETDPVARLTCGEAALYARWFGKGLADHEDWQVAADILSADILQTLRGTLLREWAGNCSFDESLRLVVTPENLHLDPRDEAEGDEVPPRELRMLYGEWAKPGDIGFRTHVSTQLGLLASAGPELSAFGNVYVRAPLTRAVSSPYKP